MLNIKRLQLHRICTIAKMVSNDTPKRSYTLEEILTKNQISKILKQVTDVTNCELICAEAKPAAEGLTGFLGDHIRVVLHVKLNDEVRKVHLFVKRIPSDNKPKAEFINVNNYFKREVLMLRLLDEMKGAEGPHPWGMKAYINTDSLIVMPDLAVAGYSEHPLTETMDLRHVTLTAASLARYHAAFANYETDATINTTQPYNFYDKYKHLLVEPTFQNTPWVRAAAKLTADVLDAFCLKYNSATILNLEDTLARSFVEACESLDVAEDNLNVMLHKDLWNNNILFKYEEGVPTNAILIDYQCVRYGPPAFDLISFLYLTTSRSFREENEDQILKYYYEVFSNSLGDTTRKRLDVMGYDEKEFLAWCEKSRKFGVFEAVALIPLVLMDAQAAARVFNDPDTFTTIYEKDRSGPVVEYAQQFPAYKQRQLEVVEEYVERFVLGQR